MAVSSHDSTEREVLKAMPRPAAIRRIVLYVVIGSAIAFLAKVVFLPWLKGYVSVNDRVEALYRFKIVMFGFGALLLPVVIYLALFAVRIIKSRQFPPPGTQVLRDTPIVRGKKALIRGFVMGLCAVWLLGCAIFAAVIPYTLSDNRGARPNRAVKQGPSHAPRFLPRAFTVGYHQQYLAENGDGYFDRSERLVTVTARFASYLPGDGVRRNGEDAPYLYWMADCN
jgi:hypothetical protein